MSQQTESLEKKVLSDLPAAVRREASDQPDSEMPLPNWLILIFGLIVCVSGGYFGMYHGGLSGGVYNEVESSPALFSKKSGSEASLAGTVAEASLSEIGKGVFANCVPCHQASGLGLPGQFPTLVGSDWVVGSEKRLVAILLKGVAGPMKVGDVIYNGAMPAWETALSDKKIAAVASYIRATWGNGAPEIVEAKVRVMRNECLSQKTPWTQEELLRIPADGQITMPDSDSQISKVPVTPSGDSRVDIAAGKTLYATVCIVCHQPTGLGLPPVFPPLVASEYVTGDPDRLAAIVLKGVAGPITVNGQIFANVMPPQEALLTDVKISQIISYVRSAFGSGASEITADQVGQVRKKFLTKSDPWTEADLKSFSSGKVDSK